MNATTLRSAPASARTPAARPGAARRVAAAKPARRGMIDRAVGWLPFGERTLQRLFLAAILAAVISLAAAFAIAAGLPAIAAMRFAAAAADAGFEVRRIDVRGVRNMNALLVYDAALAQRNRAMPLVDLSAVRARLLDLPWVKDARVSRQLPDALVIDIVERVPHAVLRKPGGRLMLIDDDGHELDAVAPEKVGAMLVVSGPGAAQRTVALGRLLEAAPALRARVREAEWIGNRRWNLTFRTGQVLALPEGDEDAARALVRFAALDRSGALIGGRFSAFDMRVGDRVYLRLPAAAAGDAAKRPIAPGPAPSAAAEPSPSPPPSPQRLPQEEDTN